jgi:hypothetical protein
MGRWSFCLLALFAISSRVEASLHQFVCDEQFSRNKITVLGSGAFEVQDTVADSVNFYAIQPLQIAVDAMQGTLLFDLLMATTQKDHIHLVFSTQGGYRLYMTWDVPGTEKGGPLPGAWDDYDGVVEWNTNNLLLDPTGDPLRGSKSAYVAAVPEPSAFGFGALALALAGGGRFVRRRWFTPAE